MMGTRADFYVGSGAEAEWLGSVAWDGYQWAEDGSTEGISTEEGFRAFVEEILSSRRDATRPEDGWPWPWDDSGMTDYVYAFEDCEVKWEQWSKRGWPDMRDRKKVTFGKRSGVTLVGPGGIID
jgi:hypothetical protein